MANVTKINVEERDYTISTDASLISYDSTASGLKSKNIQDVIDEVNEKFIHKDDLTIVTSKNLANLDYIETGKYISNTGGIAINENWSYIKIAIKPNTKYTFGGFHLERSGYFVFHDENDAKIEQEANTYIFADPKGFTNPKTVTSQSNAAYLLFDIKTPTSTIPEGWETPYDELMICEGDTLSSYEPFTQGITEIYDIELIASSSRIEHVVEPILSTALTNYIAVNDLTLESGLNLADKSNIIVGKYITNTGGIAINENWSYIKIAVKPNTNYTFGGFYLGERTGYFVFHDINDAKIEQEANTYKFTDPTGFVTPKTVTSQSNAAYLLFNIKTDSSTIPQDWETPYDELMICEGDTLLSYEPYSPEVSEINGIGLKVSNAQIRNNVNSLLTTALQPYALQSELSEYISNSDLTLIPGKNLANKLNIVVGKYISNTGGIANGADWCYIKIQVKPNTNYTFGGFHLGKGAYFVFHDENDAKIEQEANTYIFADPKGFTNPKTVTSQSNAAYLLFDIKTNGSTIPEGWETPYDELMICEGEMLPSYEPYSPEIIKINGYTIKGSNNGDDTDSGDNEIPSIENLLADLPVSDGTGIETGYAYIDSTTYTIKVKI